MAINLFIIILITISVSIVAANNSNSYGTRIISVKGKTYKSVPQRTGSCKVNEDERLQATIEGNTLPQPDNTEVVDQNEPAQDLVHHESDQDAGNGGLALEKVEGDFVEISGQRSPPHMKLSMCSTSQDYTSFDETGSCYKVHDRRITFLEAMMICRIEGAELAIINSDVEANILKTLKDNILWNCIEFYGICTKDIKTYVGALKVLDNWITLQGQTLSKAGYSSWALGEPNNDGGYENCAEIIANGKYNDVPCDTLRPFICEKKM